MKNINLENGLKTLKRKQKKSNIFKSSEFEKPHIRELKKYNFLKQIIREWYYISSPSENKSETTSWYINYWEFVAKYFKDTYGKNYCLSSEASLLLHTKETIIPSQIAVIVKNKNSNILNLLFNTSIVIYSDKLNFASEIVQIKNINIMSLEYALCKVSPSYWKENQREIEILLATNVDLKKIVECLTHYDRMESSANRIVGALTTLKRDTDANMIKSIYESASGNYLLAHAFKIKR